MKPTEKYLTSPCIDFFKPRGKDHVDLLGIIADSAGYNLITEYKKDDSRQRHEYPLSAEDIDLMYINDLHGWSIQFSQKVEYHGNFGGGINLKFSTDTEEFNFSYDQIARIRKRNNIVIWENDNLPTHQQILTHQTIEHTVR